MPCQALLKGAVYARSGVDDVTCKTGGYQEPKPKLLQMFFS
jgi:hypothetical protein